MGFKLTDGRCSPSCYAVDADKDDKLPPRDLARLLATVPLPIDMVKKMLKSDPEDDAGIPPEAFGNKKCE
jgi:hypothetical protein